MRKISDAIYVHRGVWIIKDEQGICIDWDIQRFNIYKSFNSAKEFINKYIDGTNKREPVIVGQWHI